MKLWILQREETWITASTSKGQMSTIQWKPSDTGGNSEETITPGQGPWNNQQIIPTMAYCFCYMLFSEWGVSLWMEVLPGARSHEVIKDFVYSHVLFFHLFPKQAVNWTHGTNWPAFRWVEDNLETLLSGASELVNKNWLKGKKKSI